MSKTKSKAAAKTFRTPKHEPTAPTTEVTNSPADAQTSATPKRTPAPAPMKTITVAKKEEKYEGARASWYTALVAHDGQSVDVFVEACTKTPPAMPKNGKAENPRGWLNWFVRKGIATLS